MSTSLGAPRMAVETEVVAKAQRRRFTAAEKLRVLKEADGCTKPGELGALLRREGLYSSHLATWRAARHRGELAGLTPRARGPKAKPVNPLLADAFAKHPERFPNGLPTLRALPTAVWINPSAKRADRSVGENPVTRKVERGRDRRSWGILEGRSGSRPTREPESHIRRAVHRRCSVNSRSECLKVVDRFRDRSHQNLFDSLDPLLGGRGVGHREALLALPDTTRSPR